VIPAILENKKAEHKIRIWIPGCATGEEAYSLAILLAEKTLGSIEAPKIQLFATDIDESAIATAREGYYTVNDAADVSPERLKLFFNKEGDGYRIRREIREMVLFATHNFLKDPPFSHLDLVSCRNVLIYLNHTAQERVMETFHFALRPGGFLFLGLSESAESANDLFSTYNREFHIFQSRHTAISNYPVPESTPNFKLMEPAISPVAIAQENTTRERVMINDLHQRLLEEYAPPSMVINGEYDILHLSERAGKYLQITGGEPSQNLLKLIRQELRLELRSALFQALQRQTAVKTGALRVTIGGQVEILNIHIRPVFRQGDITNGLMLVIFEHSEEEIAKEKVILSSDEPVARQLEEELIRLKAQLRAAIEQHEFQQEELKASNEELQAMNEELRSSAEELETSKEELQSINEELRTVNQELKIKVEETTLAGNNLQNLINSAEIGTIFLDRSLRVALFTPPARTIFNLIPNDIGRPLSDITNKLINDDIISEIETVLHKLQTIEREISATDGRTLLMRILPYRTESDRINGVVMTFIDMTQHKKAELVLRENEAWLNGQKEAFQAAMSGQPLAISLGALARTFIAQMQGEARVGFYMIPPGGKGLHHIVGMPDDYVRDMNEFEIGPESLACDIQMQGETMITPDVEEDPRWKQWRTLARKYGYRACWSFPVQTAGAPALGAFVIYFNAPRTPEPRELELAGIITDAASIIMSRHKELIEREQAEEALRRSEQQLKNLLKVREEFIGIASHELKTPITSMKAYAEIVLERLLNAGNEPDSELLTRLNTQIDRLTVLINGLLDTTSISEGQFKLTFQPTDLNELLVDKIEEIKRISNHRIDLDAEKLPKIIADGERIGQVITNFLSNAIKYSPKGTTIQVKAGRDKDNVSVSVQDQGYGISEEDQEKIFDRFYRVTINDFDTYPGMGLGLYISAQIIQKHQGSIDVKSTPGNGAVFSFTLPIKNKQ